MSSLDPDPPRTLAVALGANLPSKIGLPKQTLIAVRPKLEKTIKEWSFVELQTVKNIENTNEGIRFRWSPLFETDPIGGPTEQPNYVNAVVVIDGPKLWDLKPCKNSALALLDRFLNLEQEFGRQRQDADIKWGPRALDLDLLAWGGLQVKADALTLPHPRLIERSFVVVPLAAAITEGTHPPRRLNSVPGWNE